MDHEPIMQQRAEGGREMTSWPPSWTYDVVSEIDSVNRISLKINPAKFYSDPIWNDGVFFKRVAMHSPQQREEEQAQQDE